MERYNVRKSFTYEGKRYYVTGKTKKELSANMKAKLKELEKPHYYTFDEWSTLYLNTYKSNLDDNTLYNYSLRIGKYISPIIGDKMLTKITPIDCQMILNNVSSLSKNYIHKVYYDLKQILDSAVHNRLIEYNPINGCILPDGYVNTHRIITEEERIAIVSTAFDDLQISGIYILLMLYCGCRPEETSVIIRSDISDNVIHIRGTKTVLADRYVPIPDEVVNVLLSSKSENYLVRSISGISPVKKHHRTKLWNRFKKLLGNKIVVADDLTPYCLRHTYCTDLRDAGVDITVAKELMGHSTIRLTADVYTHKSLQSFEETTEKITAQFLLHSQSFPSSIDK